MLKINIGEGFDLNAQIVMTGRGCVIGQSGSGKSYLVGVISEELCRNNLPFIIIDTEGEYRNLKSRFDAIWVSSDKASDLNFEVNYSGLLRKSIDDSIPIIFDVSDESDSSGLVSKVLNKLYELETEIHKPYLVIVEEADKFAPQVVRSKEMNIIEELSVRGRKRGIGLLIATQRPANVSKNVLSQCSYGFIGRMTIQNDINAIDILLEDEENKKILTRLNVGEFVSFGLGFNGMVRVKEREIRHMGETPPLSVQRKISSFDDIINDIRKSEGLVQKEVESIKADEPKKVQYKKEDEDIIEVQIMDSKYTIDDARKFAESKANSITNLLHKYEIESIKKIYLPAIYSKLHIPTKDNSTVKEGYSLIAFNDYIIKIDKESLEMYKMPKLNYKKSALTPQESSLLYSLRGYKKATPKKISELSGSEEKESKHMLNHLVDEGILDFDGKYYSLPPIENSYFYIPISFNSSFISSNDIAGSIKPSEAYKKIGLIFAGCKIEKSDTVYMPFFKATFRRKNKIKTMLMDPIAFKDRYDEFKNFV